MRIEMTEEPKNESKTSYSQQELIDKILSDVQEKIAFYNEATERAMHIMMLNTMLSSFKNLGDQLEIISSQKHIGSPMILHPSFSEESLVIYHLTKNLFMVLDDSLRPEDDFQKIANLRPNEVDAINLSEANLPYIVPRDLNKLGSSITVSLSDLDKFRLDETQKLSQFVNGDNDAIILVREEMGGYQVDPIFPSDSN